MNRSGKLIYRVANVKLTASATAFALPANPRRCHVQMVSNPSTNWGFWFGAPATANLHARHNISAAPWNHLTYEALGPIIQLDLWLYGSGVTSTIWVAEAFY